MTPSGTDIARRWNPGAWLAWRRARHLTYTNRIRAALRGVVARYLGRI